MCKKLLIAAVAVVVGLAVVSGTRVGSHVRLWLRSGKTWMARQVKPETEIARLRMEVERLEKEDDKYVDLTSRQALEIKDRQAKLEKDEARLTTLHKRITDLRPLEKQASQGDVKTVAYREVEVSLNDIRKQIDMDFASYKPLKASVESQKSYLASLRASLAQNEEKQTNLARSRQEMLTAIQNLENQWNELKQQKAAEGCCVDGSAYGNVQRDIDALAKRLALEKEKATRKGAAPRGPIEQAEDARSRKVERDKELDAEFPLTPARPPVVKR